METRVHDSQATEKLIEVSQEGQTEVENCVLISANFFSKLCHEVEDLNSRSSLFYDTITLLISLNCLTMRASPCIIWSHTFSSAAAKCLWPEKKNKTEFEEQTSVLANIRDPGFCHSSDGRCVVVNLLIRNKKCQRDNGNFETVGYKDKAGRCRSSYQTKQSQVSACRFEPTKDEFQAETSMKKSRS